MKTKPITHLVAAAAAIVLPAGTFAQDGPPDVQPDYRPDGIICKPVRTDDGVKLRCVGDDIYNRTGRGQGLRGEATLRRAQHYGYNLQNDGAKIDAFLIRGTRGNRLFRVGYFANGRNITGRITGRGLQTGRIDPGGAIAHKIRIVVKANPRAVHKAKASDKRKHILTAVTAISRGAGGPPSADNRPVVDRVLAGTRLVRPRPSDKPTDKPGDRPSDRPSDAS